MSAEVADRPSSDSTLFATVRGGPGDIPGTGPAPDVRTPVTVVHGFAQNCDCLGPLADALTAERPTTLVDAPGHGHSSDHATADMARGAALLAATMPTGALIGYSMGGRLALRTAIDHPDGVTTLVLIGATPGIVDAAERSSRRRADHQLADRLEMIGLERFLDEWLALPMFAGLAPWARFDEPRRRNQASALADSLRHSGTGSMTPLWDRLGELAVPVLCITGAHDDRYGEIARRMVARIGPHAEHREIPDVGHSAHLEAPRVTIDVVAEFLGRCD